MPREGGAVLPERHPLAHVSPHRSRHLCRAMPLQNGSLLTPPDGKMHLPITIQCTQESSLIPRYCFCKTSRYLGLQPH